MSTEKIFDEVEQGMKFVDKYNEDEAIEETLHQLRQQELERMEYGLSPFFSDGEKIFGYQWHAEKQKWVKGEKNDEVQTKKKKSFWQSIFGATSSAMQSHSKKCPNFSEYIRSSYNGPGATNDNQIQSKVISQIAQMYEVYSYRGVSMDHRYICGDDNNKWEIRKKVVAESFFEIVSMIANNGKIIWHIIVGCEGNSCGFNYPCVYTANRVLWQGQYNDNETIKEFDERIPKEILHYYSIFKKAADLYEQDAKRLSGSMDKIAGVVMEK